MGTAPVASSQLQCMKTQSHCTMPPSIVNATSPARSTVDATQACPTLRRCAKGLADAVCISFGAPVSRPAAGTPSQLPRVWPLHPPPTATLGTYPGLSAARARGHCPCALLHALGRLHVPCACTSGCVCVCCSRVCACVCMSICWSVPSGTLPKYSHGHARRLRAIEWQQVLWRVCPGSFFKELDNIELQMYATLHGRANGFDWHLAPRRRVRARRRACRRGANTKASTWVAAPAWSCGEWWSLKSDVRYLIGDLDVHLGVLWGVLGLHPFVLPLLISNPPHNSEQLELCGHGDHPMHVLRARCSRVHGHDCGSHVPDAGRAVRNHSLHAPR